MKTSPVHLQLCLRAEAGWAVSASVRQRDPLPLTLLPPLSLVLLGVLALVEQGVLLERAGLGEATTAAQAHMGPYRAVRVAVAAQVALVGESLGAEVTAVWLVARVALHVGAQVAPALEGLAAVGARLHACGWTAVGERRGGGEAIDGIGEDESRGVLL